MRAVKQQILFVDDDVSLCELLALYLGAKGFEVKTAATGAEARQWIEMIKFDLAILDVVLQGESGLDLLDVIKNKHPNMPVLMLTGFEVDGELLKKAVQGRAEAVLKKPQSLENILLSVRWHLETASMR